MSAKTSAPPTVLLAPVTKRTIQRMRNSETAASLLLLLLAAPAVAAPATPPSPSPPSRELALPSGAPAPLACLHRYYGTGAVRDDGGWWLLLVDGRRVRYDDGKAKNPEERLAQPDVQDAFLQRYRPGAIAPVTTTDEDPGRVRIDALFQTTYGASAAEVERALVRVRVHDRELRVHRRVAPAFGRVAERLAALVKTTPSLAPFLANIGGTFMWRPIAGTDRPSAHSYGVSLDINTDLSHYWRWQKPSSPLRWQNRVPQSIVDAFEAEGFVWGGRWYHYDTMHFEYRPELLDPACYPPSVAR